MGRFKLAATAYKASAHWSAPINWAEHLDWMRGQVAVRTMYTHFGQSWTTECRDFVHRHCPRRSRCKQISGSL